MNRQVCCAGLSALTLVAACRAEELPVPSPSYPTIQSALGASRAGDEIVLADGVYSGPGNVDLAMPAHAITLRSASDDPAACVIQMNDEDERAMSGPSSGTVIRAITMRDGAGLDAGGAVVLGSGSPRFERCVFDSNRIGGYDPDSYGGAVHMTGSSAIFDRCVFTANRADCYPTAGTGDGYGGALYIRGGAPVFLDCEFSSNAATGADFGSAVGGAMYITGGADVLLAGGEVIGNSSRADGGASGGAIAINGSSLRAIGVVFEANRTGRGSYSQIASGGAIRASGSTVDLVNCKFLSNQAAATDMFGEAYGGAVSAWDTTISMTNVLLAGKEAAEYGDLCATGGAVWLGRKASLTVRSSTIWGNSATCAGGAIYLNFDSGGAPALDIAGSVLFASQPDQIAMSGPGPIVTVRYSDVEGGWAGEGNIDADPLLVDPEGGDWRLGAGSAAIDAGANDLVPADVFDLDGDGDTSEPLPVDLAGGARFVDDPAAPDTGRGTPPLVDMGAFEGQSDDCYADCDGSGELDLFDFLCFQNAFGAGDPYADCDGSGVLDLFDFLCYQNAYAAGCPF
ncbi:MAG: GC-type dockerin domain-anchored protein [Phycisphaerales bacterium JB039]